MCDSKSSMTKTDEPNDTKARLRTWIESERGAAKIEAALKDSEETSERFRKASRVDATILREPMTI